uniref:Uncharacterized protein n=1 Tax=Tanacetum cinerariifolium TaxID=118510 RepID=A0A6L2NM73_TANCI|nr:hypothetical protein [Tanacetum cinerariifolium]
MENGIKGLKLGFGAPSGEATGSMIGVTTGSEFKIRDSVGTTGDYCCSNGSLRDKIICNLNKTPDLSQRPPQNCPKCGNPVDGQYCQGCDLLRKKFKEDLVTYCKENGILQYLLDTSESSYENTNVANTLQESFVIKQDPGENSSQSPPRINHHCCYVCGDLGSTTTHSDSSLYDSFIFNLSIDLFPPADRSDFYHEEFADELAHIISPPEYDCFCFKNEPNSGDFTMDVVEDIFPTREPRIHVHNALPTHPNL